MFKQLFLPTAVCVVAVAGFAAAETAAPAALTADQYVQARQASLDMSAATMAELRQAVKDGLPVKKQAYPANALGRWARVLPTLFPAGTGAGAVSITTHAKPEVWSDRANFEKAAADYAAAADKLRDLAQADDAAGFAAQLGVLDKACDACHDKYKAK
ncbi:MAG: cytochrome c [Rhizomicrobium sp.]